MRITAASAGVGAAVGAGLFLVLRFVVGQGVLDGLSVTFAQAPRRYVDYLPTDEASTTSWRLLPVALGSGLVVGLLIGLVGRLVFARRGSAGRAATAAGLTLGGLVVGVLVAFELHAYGAGFDGGSDFGFYAYSPLPDSFGQQGGFYSSAPPGPGPWGPLLISGAVVGLVVGAVAAVAALWAGRTRRA